MTIFQQIIAGSKMGYAAKCLVTDAEITMFVIGIEDGEVLFRAVDRQTYTFKHRGNFVNNLNYCKITGWLYAGELLGDGKIPEGQRFRVKKMFGKIVTCKRQNSHQPLLIEMEPDGNGPPIICYKSEIEPYWP